MKIKPKILVVDDKQANLIAIGEILKELDVELVKVTNGNDALKETLHNEFCLALLDIQMPVMNGYELAEILRQDEKTATIPFIFISAIYISNENIFKGYEKGAFSFITKPFEPRILINKVKFFVEKYEQEQLLKKSMDQLETLVKERTAKLYKANEELVRKNEELKKINEDLDSFVYAASHDLKSPVVNIDGLFKVMATKINTKDELINNLSEKIQYSISRLKTTITALSSAAKAQKNVYDDVEEIDFNDLFKEVNMDIETLINTSNATIKKDFNKVRKIKYSKTGMKSIMYNLLSNAIKYKSSDKPLVIDIGVELDNNKPVLYVKDNGLGIDLAKDKEKLFSIFKRLHNHVEGTGVGLYTIKRIIEHNNGKIEVKSKLGEGSEFKVFFN